MSEEGKAYDAAVIAKLEAETLRTDELEAFLLETCESTGYDPGGIPIELLRMNTIGSLRSTGYIIPKRRGEYHITGFAKKAVLKDTTMWPDELQEVLQWWDQLPEVTLEHVRTYLKDYSPIPIHGLCAGQILGYELSRDEGRILPDGSIAARKFRSYPRFRILAPGTDVLRWATELSRISVREVQIRSCPTNLSPPFERFGRSHEAIYSIEYIRSNLETIFNSRARTTLRKNVREIDFFPFDPARDYEAARDLIQRWKDGPAGIKQRQLAIGRDFVCLDLARDDETIRTYSTVGYREGHLVALHIGDPLPGHPDYVAQLVEKSANYREMSGGYNGTTNVNIYAAGRYYESLGRPLIQGGAFWGGTQGLFEHKRHLTDESMDLKPVEWYLPGRFYTPETIDD